MTLYNKILKKKIPDHVAVIMDGNRRWELKNKNKSRGHARGVDVLKRITLTAKNLGIKVLTFYAFSTENWKRSKKEIDFLMNLLKEYLISEKKTMAEENIRLKTIGDLSVLSNDLQILIEDVKKETESKTAIDLVLAINYGSKNEILRAFKKILKDIKNHRITEEMITEELISNYLDTAEWKDPDLLIRTSNEFRVSNFLLWQLSYSEIFISDVLWPDFTEEHFYEAVMRFQKRNRRRGV